MTNILEKSSSLQQIEKCKIDLKKIKMPSRYKNKRESNHYSRVKIGQSHLTHAYVIRKEPASVYDTCNVTI